MKNMFFGKNKNNKGFSLVELIVAIGILAVVGTIIAFIMTTSSKNYRRMSLEAQMQSEAQLVANMISEYAIDAYDADNICGGSIDSSFDNTENKILVLSSIENKTQKMEYVIARKPGEDRIYLGSRQYDDSADAWGAFTFSLLGTFISDFTVDLSHVEKDNIIDFKLVYTKQEKTYEGNYQVLMRNRAYADTEEVTPGDKGNDVVILGLQPKKVYVDLKAGTTGDYYYIDTISEGTRRNFGARTIPFTATVTSNIPGISDGVEWTLDAKGLSVISMPQDSTDSEGNKILASSANLVFDATPNAFDTSTLQRLSSARKVTIFKSAIGSDNEFHQASKSADIYFRYVNKITVDSTPATSSTWLSTYDEMGGEKSLEAKKYAIQQYGKYVTMTLNANVENNYVPNGGGLHWTIELRKKGSTTWEACTPMYASLGSDFTKSTTTNTVSFGSKVENGQLYRVTARSDFDNTKYGTFIFGIAPSKTISSSGFNSRGYYVNLKEYFKSPDKDFGSHIVNNVPGFPSSETTNNILHNATIVDINITENGVTGFEGSVIKLIPENPGPDDDIFLFMDYGAFNYSNENLLMLYNKGTYIKLDLIAVDDNGNRFTLPVQGFYYMIYPVLVQSSSPSVMVIPRGETKNALVKTQYYNIVGEDYFGMYIDNNDGNGFSHNLNVNGQNNANINLSVKVTSGYGDVANYVEDMRVAVTAKTASPIYNANPMSLRCTADRYYVLYKGDKTKPIVPENAGGEADKYLGTTYQTSPAVDFTVYVANVVGSDVFISGPATTVGPCTFPKAAVDGGATEWVAGYTADGAFVREMAQAYKVGTEYRCNYNGVVYRYNRDLHYWFR